MTHETCRPQRGSSRPSLVLAHRSLSSPHIEPRVNYDAYYGVIYMIEGQEKLSEQVERQRGRRGFLHQPRKDEKLSSSDGPEPSGFSSQSADYANQKVSDPASDLFSFKLFVYACVLVGYVVYALVRRYSLKGSIKSNLE